MKTTVPVGRDWPIGGTSRYRNRPIRSTDMSLLPAVAAPAATRTAAPASHEELGRWRNEPLEPQIDSADAVHLAAVGDHAQKGGGARLLASATVGDHLRRALV